MHIFLIIGLVEIRIMEQTKHSYATHPAPNCPKHHKTRVFALTKLARKPIYLTEFNTTVTKLKCIIKHE